MPVGAAQSTGSFLDDISSRVRGRHDEGIVVRAYCHYRADVRNAP
jgi:hypothetical protein